MHACHIMKHFVIRNECALILKVSIMFQRNEIAFDRSGALWVVSVKVNKIYRDGMELKMWLLVRAPNLTMRRKGHLHTQAVVDKHTHRVIKRCAKGCVH